MQTNIYTLPELTFVGGKTQELRFKLKDSTGAAYNAYGSDADFSVCNYSSKSDGALFSITPEFITDSEGVADTVYIAIPSDYTKDLYGKYIYQLTFIDETGRVDIPNQGIMNITKNINPGVLTTISIA